MWAIPTDDRSTPGLLGSLVEQILLTSRFTAKLEYNMKLGSKWGLKISEVRLRNAKDYCGGHPGPCLALFPKKHRRQRFLEGLDWVGFNAMLNDAFDKGSLAADVFSFNREASCNGRYFIRRGRLRRTQYPYGQARFGAMLWSQTKEDFETCFADYCGKPPPPHPWQLLDSGTPGIPCYTLVDEHLLRAEYAPA